jgi:hypothetical protein
MVLPKSENFQFSNFKNEVILKVFNHQKLGGWGGGEGSFKIARLCVFGLQDA